MDPPPKAVSRHSSIRSSSAESDQSQQFGRLPSSLNAERAAASLPEAVAPASTSPNSTALTKTSTSVSSKSSDVDLGIAAAAAPPPLANQPRPHSSHVPSVSSPLLASSSDDLILGESQTDVSRRTSDGSENVPDRSQVQGARLLPPPSSRPIPRPGPRGPINRSTPGLGLEHRNSSGALTVHDLGTDYTRYYNPFSDSRRSSFYDNPPKTPSSQNHVNSPKRSAAIVAAVPVNPFTTPNASTTKVNENYDAEKNGALVNDRLTAPYDEKGTPSWPLITDGPEDDDDMHMPLPDDDIKFKPKLRDHFTRATICSTVGLFLMVLGLLFIFVALPVMSSVGIIDYNSMYGTPIDQMPHYFPHEETWATVNLRDYPLLQNFRRTLIDPDTPDSAMKLTGEFGDEFELVFSDEFNDNNRTFYEGDDPYWYAPDIWYGATQDLEWFDPDAVTTYDGVLELRLDKFVNHGVNFRSGMLHSWNHVCFKGGIFEVSVSLPGPAAIPGLWPGAWTMGNLGRPGYLATTEGLWPYTYQACDVGITPNQSSTDGLSKLPGQRLNSCTCRGEDHPTPGTGRGAPEIDILEAGASWGGLPIATQSYQVAPFDIWWYPDYDFTAFPDYSLSYTNGYTGGPFQQAISATTNLNKDWYDGKAYQRYSFEYAPGEGEDAHIVWKVGGQTTFMMDGRAIGPNGNIKSRQVSEEPMSMILNLGISEAWTFINWEKLVFPAVMRIDYVRWYQKKGQHMVTCDPPGFETTEYIKDHMLAYTNPNLTKWDQTGYGVPKHKLNTDC